jgi:hypothetical protein
MAVSVLVGESLSVGIGVNVVEGSGVGVEVEVNAIFSPATSVDICGSGPLMASNLAPIRTPKVHTKIHTRTIAAPAAPNTMFLGAPIPLVE